MIAAVRGARCSCGARTSLERVVVYARRTRSMGAIAIPLWSGWRPYQQNRLLTFLNPEVDPQRGGLPRHPVEGGHRLGRLVRQRVSPRVPRSGWPSSRSSTPTSSSPWWARNSGFVGVLAALILFLVLFLIAAPDRPPGHRPVREPGGVRDPGPASSRTSSRTSG